MPYRCNGGANRRRRCVRPRSVFGVVQLDNSVGKMNIGPPQGKQLATAHCGFDDEDVERADVLIAPVPSHEEPLGHPGPFRTQLTAPKLRHRHRHRLWCQRFDFGLGNPLDGSRPVSSDRASRFRPFLLQTILGSRDVWVEFRLRLFSATWRSSRKWRSSRNSAQRKRPSAIA